MHTDLGPSSVLGQLTIAYDSSSGRSDLNSVAITLISTSPTQAHMHGD